MSASLETIYTDFHSKLHRFIAGRVSDPDTAEDILQEVYLKIHVKIDDLREEERLESWIYQITRNAIIDYYRRKRPQDELSDQLALAPSDDVDATSDLVPSVSAMLDCLPPKYRQALILTEFHGLTQQELADQLRLSLSGAKSRVQRAREKLREAFLDCCHFEFDRRGRVIQYQPRCAACASEA